jgi:hypothetical protein
VQFTPFDAAQRGNHLASGAEIKVGQFEISFVDYLVKNLEMYYGIVNSCFPIKCHQFQPGGGYAYFIGRKRNIGEADITDSVVHYHRNNQPDQSEEY